MNSTAVTLRPDQPVGVFAALASHYGMDVTAFERVVMQTLMPSGTTPSKEHVAAFLLVAREHKLNPFTKEIFAFPAKGAIQAVVSVDGWMKLINSHPDFDGMSFKDTFDAEGRLLAVTCCMHRKGRSHPVEVTEYMSECKRATDTWRQWPARMLRHKAAIQAARYAFSFAGIMEPDEAERMIDPPTVERYVATAEPERGLPSDGVVAGLLPEERDAVDKIVANTLEYIEAEDLKGALEYQERREALNVDQEAAIHILLGKDGRAALRKAERDAKKEREQS